MPVNVLIVDDEPLQLRMMTRLLERNGLVVTQASSATEAMPLVAQASVVLTDIRMPGGSGLDLVAWIAREHPFVGVVMVTGLDDPSLARLAVQRGAVAYVVKPATGSELVAAVLAAERRGMRIGVQTEPALVGSSGDGS